MVPSKFQDLFLWKSAIGILMGIALNLEIILNSIDIFAILFLPMNTEYLSIYLCFLQFHSLMLYAFQYKGLLPPWLNLFLGIL